MPLGGQGTHTRLSPVLFFFKTLSMLSIAFSALENVPSKIKSTGARKSASKTAFESVDAPN